MSQYSAHGRLAGSETHTSALLGWVSSARSPKHTAAAGTPTQVAKIAPRPLFLISSGTSYERDANRVFYRAAGQPKTLWEMPNASHTSGLAAFPREYERRVVAFFNRALVGNR